MSGKPDPVTRARNLALAAVAGQVGFVTVVVIVGALLIGLWLDAQIGVKGPFTILLLVLSVPLSLYLVFRMALQATNAIHAPEMGEADDAEMAHDTTKKEE